MGRLVATHLTRPSWQRSGRIVGVFFVGRGRTLKSHRRLVLDEWVMDRRRDLPVHFWKDDGYSKPRSIFVWMSRN